LRALCIYEAAHIIEITSNKSQITNKSQYPKFKIPINDKKKSGSMRINTFGHWILEIEINL